MPHLPYLMLKNFCEVHCWSIKPKSQYQCDSVNLRHYYYFLFLFTKKNHMMYRIIVLFYLRIWQYNHLISFNLIKWNLQNLYSEINFEKQQEVDYHISKKARISIFTLFLDPSKTCRFVLMFIFGVVNALFDSGAM